MPTRLPTRSDLAAVIPEYCGDRHLGRSLLHAATSVLLTIATGLLAWRFLPLAWEWAPLWLLYMVVCGTFATGVWVVAHECGHRAFCRGTKLQDSIGFVLHSAMLVPYFSWQRSHAVHHAKTNHLTEGETHVPKADGTAQASRSERAGRVMGRWLRAVVTLASRLGTGWPMYLLVGATGGPRRGVTNHFWPKAPFSQALFPGRWPRRVILSSAGVAFTIVLLGWWAFVVSNISTVLALYVGPLLVVNAWLVAYTWLQHTDVDIPHYDDDDWSFVRGAFCTVDRPYGPVVNFLHHHIGSTHVAHHINAKIPHYRAKAATQAIADAFPDLYRYDPTPIPKALWRVARDCHVVAKSDDGWRFKIAQKSES